MREVGLATLDRMDRARFDDWLEGNREPGSIDLELVLRAVGEATYDAPFSEVTTLGAEAFWDLGEYRSLVGTLDRICGGVLRLGEVTIEALSENEAVLRVESAGELVEIAVDTSSKWIDTRAERALGGLVRRRSDDRRLAVAYLDEEQIVVWVPDGARQ